MIIGEVRYGEYVFDIGREECLHIAMLLPSPPRARDPHPPDLFVPEMGDSET